MRQVAPFAFLITSDSPSLFSMTQKTLLGGRNDQRSVTQIRKL